MAALQPVPPASHMVSIREGMDLLASTEHPVTHRQLADGLAGAQRRRQGKTDYYDISDVLVAHRKIVDRRLN